MRTLSARLIAAGVFAAASVVSPAAAAQSVPQSVPQSTGTCWAAVGAARPPSLSAPEPPASLWMCNGPDRSREYGLGSLVWWGPDWGEPSMGGPV